MVHILIDREDVKPKFLRPRVGMGRCRIEGVREGRSRRHASLPPRDRAKILAAAESEAPVAAAYGRPVAPPPRDRAEILAAAGFQVPPAAGGNKAAGERAQARRRSDRLRPAGARARTGPRLLLGRRAAARLQREPGQAQEEI